MVLVRRLTNVLSLEKSGILIGGSIGLTFFLFVFGANIIHPQHIAWLLENTNQDAIQHFVGWEFFRNEAWHFPLGVITNYGYPFQTSIVYTDSIPVLALLFKCFSGLLPSVFQYFGLWYALCFFLQGVFAWAISAYMTKNNVIKSCITLFFLLSPIMLNRMIEHQALVAHWVILSGLLLYIRPYQKSTNLFWLLLNAVTILIHAYLALMLLALWAAFLLKNIFIARHISINQAVRLMLTNLFVMIFLAWMSGYFVIPFSSIMDAGGYSMDSMNLLAPFKPGTGSLIAPGNWSRFIKPFTPFYIEQGDEGFNYLGLGMLMLLALSLYCLVKQLPDKKTLTLWSPMICVCAALSFYALSNIIYVGQHILFSYSLPGYSSVITDMFRASGRFFWPAYYLLMMMVFIILNRRLKNHVLIPLFVIALALQIADLSIKINELHQRFMFPSTVQATSESSIWQTISGRYTRIAFLPPLSRPQTKIVGFGDYIHYAATHNMSVNLGYFARQNNGEYVRFGKQLLTQAFQGKFSADTVYIVLNPRIAAMLKPRLSGQDTVARVGTYMVIFPGEKKKREST